MDIRQLKHFVAIVDHGTFLKAAKAIPISQPALTRSLQNLEFNLGVTLLNRSTRGIQITDIGERLYRRAQLIISESERAITEARNQSSEIELKVGMAPMFAGQLLPEVLRSLATSNPEIKMVIISGLFEDLVNDLSSGKIDIMISNLPFTDLHDDLEVQPLLDITIDYVASSIHPLCKKSELKLKDLIKFPWAVVDVQHANDLYSYIFTSEGETSSPITLKTNSLTLLKSIITQPPFITLLPHHMVKSDVANGNLAILNVNQDTLRRKGGLIYRKNILPNPTIEMFINAVKAAKF